MLPRIGRPAVEAELPLRFVIVAELLASRQGEAVIQQPHASIRRLALAVELDPADQGLICQHDKIRVATDRLVIVAGDELAFFGKLDHAADDVRWRDFVEILLYAAARIQRRKGYRRGRRLGGQPLDFVLWRLCNGALESGLFGGTLTLGVGFLF